VKSNKIPKKKKGEITMAKYVCTVCGFVYDEAEGYPDGGIAPGTKWEDVPEDFTCPLCGVDKSMFEAQ
jgi:rubredoxin